MGRAVSIDPTGLERRRAGVRPADHDQRGHGAATDRESVWSFVHACQRRQAESARAALVVGRRRGYTEQDHERAEALRGEAEALRRIAAAKPEHDQRALVEREAQNLDDDAERIVPLQHARSSWR